VERSAVSSPAEMKFYGLTLGILAVWRIAHLFNAEDGPWQILVRLRRRAGSGFWGELLDCFYCLSLWVAIPFAILISEQWRERLLLWLALSAGAILIERLTREEQEAAAHYSEEGEGQHGMLRQGPTEPGCCDEAEASRSTETRN
jgi:hypothetical protein